jgi:hypothetical protein
MPLVTENLSIFVITMQNLHQPVKHKRWGEESKYASQACILGLFRGIKCGILGLS